MKSFPLSILFLCVAMPPLCYLLTVQGAERWLQRRESAAIQQGMIRDVQALYEGRHSVKEETRKNIDARLKGSWMPKLGVSVQVLVKTKDNIILYPPPFELDLARGPEGPVGPGREPPSYLEVASENYKLMNEGLDSEVEVKIRHGGWLGNIALLFYLSVSLLILRGFLRKAFRQKEAMEAEQEGRIRELAKALDETKSKLEEVGSKEREYENKIRTLQEDKRSLSKDVDDLLGEIEGAEKDLEVQRHLREEMETQVLTLNEELDRLRSRIEKTRKRKRGQEDTEKRFRVLYKNLLFTERALDGYQELTAEFQLKAEELIYRLNQDDALVPVRRKVFGKGGKLNVLEADFSYSGRIYFQKSPQGKIRVMAIGTKNTQDQDLTYLESAV